MGCRQSHNLDSDKLHLDVFYCGGNTVKPYFDELKEHLEDRFQDKISIRGKQDMMFSGRFEVYLCNNKSDGGSKKELIHSKKTREKDGWARRPEERSSIEEKIQAELDRREAAQQ